MSWSIHSSGSKAAVRADIAEQFAKYPCEEPEETLRQRAGALVLEVLAANPDNVASVSVSCNGSAYTVDGEQLCNSIAINVHCVPKY